jgi:hypothetical protein
MYNMVIGFLTTARLFVSLFDAHFFPKLDDGLADHIRFLLDALQLFQILLNL